jgi:hypothetical protein
MSADLLADVERDYAALLSSARRLEAGGEPWANAIVMAVERKVGFEIDWFKSERERRAADAAERAKEKQE